MVLQVQLRLVNYWSNYVKKLIFAFGLLFATQACAQQENLSDIPPTYEYGNGQFSIELPMLCTTDSESVFDRLNSEGYKMSFLGQTESMAGGALFVSVFVHPEAGDYHVLLTNKDTGGVCEITSGPYGQSFSIDGTNI